jgi:hypothetical protein
LDRVARRWTPLTFDVRFLRARCPKFDVGGEAIGEFLRSGPLRFALAMRSGGQRAVPDESAASTRSRSIGWRIQVPEAAGA